MSKPKLVEISLHDFCNYCLRSESYTSHIGFLCFRLQKYLVSLGYEDPTNASYVMGSLLDEFFVPVKPGYPGVHIRMWTLDAIAHPRVEHYAGVNDELRLKVLQTWLKRPDRRVVIQVY